MWRIKRRRTKPKTEGNKVIYPKLNATAKPNRYQSRNTYLDVKCNKELGAGCTDVGCQCQDLLPNITSFSDITGVADYKTRVNTIAPASFHDFTTWYGPDTNLGTTYQGVYGNSAPPSGNANFSLPLPAVYNHISITYNNPHPGSGSDAVYIFIGGVGSGALPTENPLASQAVNEIKNGTTGASKTYSQRYQAGDYLKIQEKASVITTALVIELTYVPNNFICCKTAPYRNPILGYRKHLIDCSGNTDLSGCGYTKDVSGNVYKDNYAKTCATHPEACYNQVIRTKQNKNGCVDESYNYSTNQYLNRRCLKFQQQEFNFQSQAPVDTSGCCSKFKSCNNCQYKTNGDCDCSANGFCTGINKLPCETKNTKCYAIYKRSNPKFKKQGAVSGGSRINRLKYQTRMKAQGRTVNGRKNVINGRRPATLYRTSKPLTLRDNTCINPPPPPSHLTTNKTAIGIFVSGSSSLFGPPAIPSNNTLMYSTDGINWVGLGNTVFGSRVNSVKWNGKIWVAVGGHKDTNSVAYSYDGFNWVGVGDPFSLSTNNGFGIDVASNGSDWIAISNNNIIASTNGIDWNPINLPASFSPFGIAYGQDKWLLFGEDLNPSPKKNIWYSTDNGNSWSSVSMDGLLSIYADRGFYNGSLWVAVGTGTNKIIYSADGVNWNAGNNVGITTVAQDVFYNGSLWVAVGVGGQPLIWSNDGINWNNAVNQPLTIVNGVTWNSSINLWVATNGSSASGNDFVYSVDGKNWTGIPADPNLLNTGTGNYLDSGTTILGSSIITVNWKNPDISKLCRIAPVTGYTIEATSNSFKETQFVFGNSFTFNNLPTGTYDIKIRSESYYGSSDWAYLYNILIGNQ